MRRSLADRYVAGVAGGIGRHFGVDPTIIRVLFVVATFFGGAGVLVYAVCWLFVPEDGAEHGPIHVGGEPRKLLLIAAVAVAFLLAMGDAFSGFSAGWWIAVVAVVVAAVLIARDRREHRGENRPDQPFTRPFGQPLAQPVSQAGAPTVTEQVTPAEATQPLTYASTTPPAPPAWQPPQPPLVPPRPKRTGILWFGPTLALIAIGLGILGVVNTHHHLVPAAYPALALGITGVMLLIGAVTGRPGGLILIGIISTMALTFATVIGGFNFKGRAIDVAPNTAAAVQSSYTAENGKIRIDLSRLQDPQALAGRTIDVSLKAGRIQVIVPRSLNVDIHAEFGFAGGIRVPGYDGGGLQDSVERHLVGSPATTTPELDLRLDASVGQITVEQR